MEKIKASNKVLIKAVKIWTASKHGFPTTNDDAVIKYFGKKGESILSGLKELKGDFDKSDAWKKASDMQEMAKLAETDFVKIHPDIPKEIVKIFSNSYVYNCSK